MKQTKTIPFDWELYNNNRDKYKVVTRDGDEVNQLTKFEGITSFAFIGCHVPNGIHVLRGWQIDGKFYEGAEYRLDLLLQYEEEVFESWVNLYRKDDGSLYLGHIFKCEYDCKSVGNSQYNYIKTINLNDLV
jgi:hypothetical protein